MSCKRSFLSSLMLIVNVIYFQFVAEATEISISPERKVLYATEHSNVTIICMATELNEKTVRWDHNGRQIASVAPPTTVFSDPADRSKYIIKGADPEGGNFSFTLLNYNKDDAGIVTCDVAGVEPVNIQLETFVEPEEIYMSVTSPYRNVLWEDGAEGIGLNIELFPPVSCSVINSQPAASIRWLWNGNDTLISSLNITEIAQTDGQLHNVTSVVVLTPVLLEVHVFEEEIAEVEEDGANNMTIIEVSDTDALNDTDGTFVENVSPNGDLEMQTIKTNGELSCEMTVGDRIYIESLLIDFAGVNSGYSGLMMTNHIMLVGVLLMTFINVY